VEQSWVRCPACGVGLLLLDRTDPRTGMVVGTCGHLAYSGYLAELLYLRRRSGWLTDRVREGSPPPPPALAREYGVWDPPATTAVAVPTGRAAPVATASPVPPVLPPQRRAPGLQGVLLASGAVLLVLAAAVFTAVAWPRLGVVGQVLLVLLATLASAGAAIGLRRRLRGTAQAFAALAVGLALVVLAAVPALGLAPRGWIAVDSGYWTLGLLLVGGLALLGGRRFDLPAWTWLGWLLLGAALVVTAATAWSALGHGPATAAGVFGVAAVLAVVAGSSPWWWDDLRAERGPVVLAATGVLLVSGSVLAGLALSGEAVAPAGGALGAVGLSVLLVDRRVAPARGGPLAAAGVVLLAAAAGTLLAAAGLHVLTAVVSALLGVAVLLVAIRTGHGPVGLLAAVTGWTTWLVLLVVTVLGPTVGPVLQTPWAVFFGLTGAGVLLAGIRAPRDSALALLPWPAAVLLFVAFVIAVPASYPEVLEAWTLPLAGLLAIAGLASTTGRDAPTALRWGPAASAALLPSAVATWSAPWVEAGSGPVTEHLLRLVLVLVAGALVLVVGVRRRAAGLVVPASVALGLAGFAQLWTGLQALPRWVALAVVGAGLVLTGARFEWVRSEGRRARTWVRGLE
jgi:hypothetical protein